VRVSLNEIVQTISGACVALERRRAKRDNHAVTCEGRSTGMWPLPPKAHQASVAHV
jgi:hypothetical protein